MKDKPRLLDLFSGAGGAARGYQRAGFHVTGIDHRPQPRYAGDVFVQADALEYLAAHGGEFDAIHASPPCQAYTSLRTMHPGAEHPDLVGPTRELLRASGLPWVIENVPGAPLRRPVLVCGSMFGLRARRHRLFESSIVLLVPSCKHAEQGTPLGVYGCGGGRRHEAKRRWGVRARKADLPAAMGIDWMTFREAAQAIPPCYTELIGCQLINALGGLS